MEMRRSFWEEKLADLDRQGRVEMRRFRRYCAFASGGPVSKLERLRRWEVGGVRVVPHPKAGVEGYWKRAGEIEAAMEAVTADIEKEIENQMRMREQNPTMAWVELRQKNERERLQAELHDAVSTGSSEVEDDEERERMFGENFKHETLREFENNRGTQVGDTAQ